MQWAWSYVSGNLSLILLFVAAIAALGLFAFFARSWKAAIAAVALLAVGFGIQQIDKNAFQRAEAARYAGIIATLHKKMDAANKANQADAERAIENATEIARLDALAHDTPANVGDCLDIDAARRVRAIR
jgi:negative regulator of sigma E activity